ncbi:MAG: cytochrome c oxidase subunit 4 [Candidatus Nanopelagicales bacterium]|nr:cytochrome c oxidase subunit 4 [Candidatus Nanopelagicales bacterium]
MKIEGKLFAYGTPFFFIVAFIYNYVSHDPIGTTVLAMCGGLTALVAFYVLYTAKRVFPRPEDRGEANIDEADPEYGFFSPHSWWPLMIGFGTTVVVLGLVFAVWLTALGAFVLVIALVGWLFEYYRGNFAQ